MAFPLCEQVTSGMRINKSKVIVLFALNDAYHSKISLLFYFENDFFTLYLREDQEIFQVRHMLVNTDSFTARSCHV